MPISQMTCPASMTSGGLVSSSHLTKNACSGVAPNSAPSRHVRNRKFDAATRNCIRAFPGRGIRIWGARTLSSDPEWRYINVRRLFNFISESIMEGTQWSVFEPNDEKLWIQLRIAATNFLTRVWSDGALFGSTPGEAFYVKCDSETNPPEVIEAGQVICEIGISPVKPAEFVVFRLSQFSGGEGSAVSE